MLHKDTRRCVRVKRHILIRPIGSDAFRRRRGSKPVGRQKSFILKMSAKSSRASRPPTTCSSTTTTTHDGDLLFVNQDERKCITSFPSTATSSSECMHEQEIESETQTPFSQTDTSLISAAQSQKKRNGIKTPKKNAHMRRRNINQTSETHKLVVRLDRTVYPCPSPCTQIKSVQTAVGNIRQRRPSELENKQSGLLVALCCDDCCALPLCCWARCVCMSRAAALSLSKYATHLVGKCSPSAHIRAHTSANEGVEICSSRRCA